MFSIAYVIYFKKLQETISKAFLKENMSFLLSNNYVNSMCLQQKVLRIQYHKINKFKWKWPFSACNQSLSAFHSW